MYGLNVEHSPLHNLDTPLGDVLLKRDDLLDLNCSKQRSIPLLIDFYLQNGIRDFVIASTGNAALVAIYCALQNPKINSLTVCFSYMQNFSEIKFKRFKNLIGLDLHKIFSTLDTSLETNEVLFRNKVTLTFSNNPKQQAFLLGKKKHIVFLRSATENISIEGYKTISYELVDQLKQMCINRFQDAPIIPNIYICSSSGATAIGIYKGLKESDIKEFRLNIVQTTKVYTLVRTFYLDGNLPEQKKNIEPDHPADSIVDIIGHRRGEVEQILLETNSNWFVISKSDCIHARRELKNKYQVNASYDSALTYAALKKEKNISSQYVPILIFTG